MEHPRLRLRARRVLGASQKDTARNSATIASIRSGNQATRKLVANVTASSMRLSATFENGSRLRFAVTRIPAFAPGEMDDYPSSQKECDDPNERFGM